MVSKDRQVGTGDNAPRRRVPPTDKEWVLYGGREVRNPFISSEEGMRRTVTAMTSQGLLIVGSLGRAAIYNALLHDPMYEFTARGESALMSDQPGGRQGPRDVDIMGGEYTGHFSDYFPHRPDNGAAHMITRDQNNDWVFTNRVGNRVYLEPSLFESVNGETLYDVPCVTVRPATHVALITSRSLCPKDILARQLLEGVLPAEERALLETSLYREFESILLSY